LTHYDRIIAIHSTLPATSSSGTSGTEQKDWTSRRFMQWGALPTASSYESEEPEPEPELVPLEPRGVERLRFMLTSSSSPSCPAWRARLWATSITVTCVSCAYIVWVVSRPEFVGRMAIWQLLGGVAAVIFSATGVVGTECTILMAGLLPRGNDQALNAALASNFLEPGDGRERFMETLLLQARVTPVVARNVERRWKKSLIQVSGPFGVFFLNVLIIGPYMWNKHLELEGSGVPEDLVAIVGFFCSFPITAMVLSGWLTFIHLPCMVANDVILQRATSVRAMARYVGDDDGGGTGGGTSGGGGGTGDGGSKVRFQRYHGLRPGTSVKCQRHRHRHRHRHTPS
jgi:hypothetical protein